MINKWSDGNGGYVYTLSRVVVDNDTKTQEANPIIDVRNVVNKDMQGKTTMQDITVAWIHTHPNTDDFTARDYSYGFSWSHMERAYLITPNGTVIVSERRLDEYDFDSDEKVMYSWLFGDREKVYHTKGKVLFKIP